MNLPKKMGNAYVKFDENNNPEYCFEVEETYKVPHIKKIIIMTDKKLDTIVLPKLYDKKDELKNGRGSRYNFLKKYKKEETNFGFMYDAIIEDYAIGEVKLCENCFKGIKNAKIIVPFEASIMVDYGSFDKDANIEFVTSKNMALKQVYRRFDTVVDTERENWTIIADKSFYFSGKIRGDDYYIEDYNEKRQENKVANLKLSNELVTKDYEYEKTL